MLNIQNITEIQHDCDFSIYSRKVYPGMALGFAKTLASNIKVDMGDAIAYLDGMNGGDIDDMVCVSRTHARGFIGIVRGVNAREAEQAA